MKEVWVDICGYDGFYQVSNIGNVRRTRYCDAASASHHTPMRNMKSHVSSLGYHRIKLTINGVSKLHFIHRLVAGSFIPNPNGLPCVNHMDGNKSNNCVSNLEWCSHAENNAHANALGLRVLKNKKGSRPVSQFTIDGSLVASFPSANESSRKTGFASSHIQDCCNGKSRSWKGYLWRWSDTVAPGEVVRMRPHGNSGRSSLGSNFRPAK